MVTKAVRSHTDSTHRSHRYSDRCERHSINTSRVSKLTARATQVIISSRESGDGVFIGGTTPTNTTHHLSHVLQNNPHRCFDRIGWSRFRSGHVCSLRSQRWLKPHLSLLQQPAALCAPHRSRPPGRKPGDLPTGCREPCDQTGDSALPLK